MREQNSVKDQNRFFDILDSESDRAAAVKFLSIAGECVDYAASKIKGLGMVCNDPSKELYEISRNLKRILKLADIEISRSIVERMKQAEL